MRPGLLQEPGEIGDGEVTVDYMKAIILAAGRSTRTYPLTVDLPKAMLKIANKELLRHSLETLDGLVDEVVVVVGFGKDLIMKAFGRDFNGIKLTYAEQKDQLGTGHAVLAAEQFIGNEEFIIMNGDDIYSRKDLERMIEESPAALSQEVDDARPFGIWLEKEGRISGYEEKPATEGPGLVNTGTFVLGPELFMHIRNLKKTSRGEYELNEAVNSLARDKPVRIVKTKEWMPVGYPWHVLDANRRFLDGMKESRRGTVEPGVTINGKVSIGKGTVVKAGTYIEGPVMIGEDCVIGPNAYLRPYSTIGDKCRVGNASEVKNSVIGDGSKAPHFNYVGDSVIGRDVNLAGYTFTANLRHDRTVVRTAVKGNLMETGKAKFGSVIGDGARLGASTMIYPGRKIWPGKRTLPGQAVTRDVE
jgi:UDP-N-acetylglucosamine diphosphorylase / glucose-1-phosphate thymidylyltransferase / UDP-N-acetylgalactosamine diphosphorylase / glucosamine-1-phosphate N-acetyltransferase / galactosamine-1-phosphate N-acetyltransferase